MKLTRWISFAMLMALVISATPPAAHSQCGAQPEKKPTSEIRNFLRINKDFCTGGQPRIEQLAALKAEGVTTIINLRPPTEHRAAEEEAKAKELGLRYFNVPVVYTSPRDEDADAFLKVMDDKQNRPAFIHCTAAIRAGAFWMIYRALRDGWDVDRAEKEAYDVGLRNAQHLNDFARAYIARHRKPAGEKPGQR